MQISLPCSQLLNFSHWEAVKLMWTIVHSCISSVFSPFYIQRALYKWSAHYLHFAFFTNCILRFRCCLPRLSSTDRGMRHAVGIQQVPLPGSSLFQNKPTPLRLSAEMKFRTGPEGRCCLHLRAAIETCLW